MAGLVFCDWCRSGIPARMCPGRLRGMDLSVARHAVHGATISNGILERFAHLTVSPDVSFRLVAYGPSPGRLPGA
ncbi:hypothetical protein GCM10009647_003190 [Streptomyces sanglieri]